MPAQFSLYVLHCRGWSLRQHNAYGLALFWDQLKFRHENGI
jgi:hypothetical protein